MALLTAGSCNVMWWTMTLVFLCAILKIDLTESATYGANCLQSGDCVGRGLTCSLAHICTCSQGYTYSNGEKECQVSQTPFEDEVLVPDLYFSMKSKFLTNMTREDLDLARKEEISSQLESQLTELFRSITGFKEADVSSLTVNEKAGVLEARWTVKLRRNDPKFVNATPEEIGNIVRPELAEASRRYKDVVRIDTSKRDRPMKSSIDKLALGLGVGLAGLLIVCVGLAVVIVLHRKQHAHKPPSMSISDQSSSCDSGGSSKMDPDNYQYNVLVKDGFSLPPHYASCVPPSVTGSSLTVSMETSDKLPLHNSS